MTPNAPVPNILMLFSDQHNARLAGFAGSSLVDTPNLDRLAAEGVRFTDAYCNSPLCSPSRQSFMSGLYCQDIRVWNNVCSMPDDTVTWAHALSAAGYETSLIGKMHLNGYQKMYGFDRRPVKEGNNDGETFYSWGVRANHFWTDPLPYSSGDTSHGGGPDTPERELIFRHDLKILDGTLAFLEEKAADTSGRPWAMCSAMVLPHPPYRARQDLWDAYARRADIPVNPRGEGLGTVDACLRKFYNTEDMTDEQILSLRRAYFGLITEYDEYAGRVLDALDRLGLAENTIVFYFSDHGEMAGEHGMVGKVTLRESSARVPLIVRWKGHFLEGAACRTPVSLVDLYPTFLDVARAGLPDVLPLRGSSLVPLLTADEHAFAGDGVFCEFEGEGWNHPRAFFRDGRYKYVHNHTAQHELYDLEDDPDELNNLSCHAEFADVDRRLRERLLALWDPESIEKEVIASQWRKKLAFNKNVCKDLGW